MAARDIARRRDEIIRRLALAGITRKRLAALAKYDESTLGLFLNGHVNAQAATLERIERALAEELERKERAFKAEELARLDRQQRELASRRRELKRRLEERCP